MKKTININLGGQPFTIDEPAFDILHHYFEALKLKFTNEAEQKEILSDIEARVGEVFAQRLGKTRAVVSEEDVVYIISLMGKPEDIAGETEPPVSGQDTKTTTTTSSTAYTGPAEKKFFRDPDNKKVGGVISGLCHYFGWGDPTWIRVAVVGLVVISMFFSLGLGVPIAIIYLILLIVVPEASSSAEKLQMRGQPVTIQNIEKEVRDAMTTAGNSINTVMKDDNNRKVVSVTLSLGRALAKLVLVFVIMICVLLMLVLAGSCFSLSLLSSSSLTEITHLLVSSRYLIMMFNVGLLLVVGIPLVSIMYDAIRYLTNNTQVRNPILKRVLWGVWFVGLILLGISSWSLFKDFAAADTTTQKVQLWTPKNGTLHVQLADTMGNVLTVKSSDDEEISSIVNIGGISRTEYGFAVSDIRLEIAVSPDTNFYVEKVAFSRGSNFADAGKNIQMMHYKFSQTDTTLNLDDKFELPKDGKWRGQRLKIRIYVPEGKRISFGENVDQIDASVKGNDYFDDELPGKTLQVEGGKIKCLDCKEKVITDESTDEDKPDVPDAPDAPDAPEVPGKKSGSKHENLKNVSVNINQNGVSVTGDDDKDGKVKIKVNDKGVRIITTDSNGNTKVTKK